MIKDTLKQRIASLKFYHKNEDAQRQRHKEYYWTHHEEELKRHHEWYHNKGGKGVYSKTSKVGKINARKIVIDHYSNGKNSCACCNEKIYEFLTIDHLNGGGTKHRKTIARYNICIWLIQNNFPEGFQILCYNCNAAKQFNHGCPHKQQMIHVIPPDSRCVIEQ